MDMLTPRERRSSSRESSLQETVGERITELTAWLAENAPECPEDQKHLDEGSAERAYWHYGYLIALRDVLNLIEGRSRSLN